ncbi:MAG: histidine phosphatase family protein [Steroidobacteraceae bacterium]
MRRLILIRHPATAMSGTFCGHTDPDVSPKGEAQLAALLRTLQGTSIDRIVSSDLRRAQRCADALARQHALTAELRSALREIHFGAWEGLRWRDIEARYREEAHRWMEEFPGHTPPGAEPYMDFAQRIHDDAAHWLHDPSCKTLAVVTHRGVLQHLLRSHCALESSAAWQMTSRPATAIFCEMRENGSFAARETWFPR